MPLYEYYCTVCGVQFEKLRSMSQALEPALCPGGHEGARRTLSMFAAVSREAGPGEAPLAFGSAGGTGCACGGVCACGGH